MDQSTLLKIARLRTLAARKGRAFDVARFAGDRAFAEATLHTLVDTDDEDLLVLGLEVMQALGFVKADQAPPPAAEAPAAGPKPKPAAQDTKDQVASRYVGRLR